MRIRVIGIPDIGDDDYFEIPDGEPCEDLQALNVPSAG